MWSELPPRKAPPPDLGRSARWPWEWEWESPGGLSPTAGVGFCLELMLKENYLSSIFNSGLVLKDKAVAEIACTVYMILFLSPFCLSSFTLIQISQMSVILSPLFLAKMGVWRGQCEKRL